MTVTQQFRRLITQAAIRQSLRVTAKLSTAQQRFMVRSLLPLATATPTLRRRIRENMHLARGTDVPAKAEELYFQHLGWLAANALSTFHHGLDASGVLEQVKFDSSFAPLESAAANGRGVVIASPHWIGHELFAAALGRRVPMVFLVRQAATAEQMQRKLAWYGALGVEIVLRPSQSAPIKSAAACLHALRRGKVLSITPDLLAGPGEGVETQICGRPARLYGGAFAIALSAKIPVFRPWPTWQSDSTVVMSCERSPISYDCSDRGTAICASVQNWCRWFEQKLTANPENWYFWLDKRWSRFLRTTPRTSRPLCPS